MKPGGSYSKLIRLCECSLEVKLFILTKNSLQASPFIPDTLLTQWKKKLASTF
jgi:hypothetical protein